jgi:glycine transporter
MAAGRPTRRGRWRGRCRNRATCVKAFHAGRSRGLPTLLVSLDLAGTFIYAVNGGLTAVHAARLDIVGVITLAMVSGLGGGIIRDVLLGALPPATFSDWRYLAVAAGGGLAAFALSRPLTKLASVITALDAAGLGLFAVTGASKSPALGLVPAPAVILGAVPGSAAGHFAMCCSDRYRLCSGAGSTPSRPCSPRGSRSRRSGQAPTDRPPRSLPRSPVSPSGCSASATTSTPRCPRERPEILRWSWRQEQRQPTHRESHGDSWAGRVPDAIRRARAAGPS